MKSPSCRLGIFQFAPVLRQRETNANRIVAAGAEAAQAGVDLLVTPELALTGYDVGDDAAALGIRFFDSGRRGDSSLDPLLRSFAEGPELVLGFIELSRGGLPYNAAVHLQGGRAIHRHRKVYLPTYGMFDEARFFARGQQLDAYDAGGGWRVGQLVCEDFWHPSLPYLLAVRGIDLLVVLAAAPGRGVIGGAGSGARFSSWPVWERMAVVTAQIYGIYVVVANRIGVEGGVTFAGGSFAVDPAGEVVARAPADEEKCLLVDLDLAEVARARRGYSHLRDEDPALLLRELERLLRTGPHD